MKRKIVPKQKFHMLLLFFVFICHLSDFAGIFLWNCIHFSQWKCRNRNPINQYRSTNFLIMKYLFFVSLYFLFPIITKSYNCQERHWINKPLEDQTGRKAENDRGAKINLRYRFALYASNFFFFFLFCFLAFRFQAHFALCLVYYSIDVCIVRQSSERKHINYSVEVN